MNPRTHTLLPLAAIAGLALTASAWANTEVVANFYTSASASKGALTTGGLYSPLQLGASTASPFTYEYDISGLGLGAANKLKITVATTGANLNNGGNNGIAVVGGGNNAWWDGLDGALTFTVVIADAGDADITSNFNIDLTGAAIRWTDTTPASVTLSVAGSDPFSRTVLNQGVDLPTGQTAETSFTATRTGSTVGQFQQLRFVIYDPNSDVTAPALTGKNPADDASGVAIDANLVATFSEFIALTGTGSVTIRDLGPGPDVVIPLPDAQVTVSGTTLTINPTANLLPNNPYAVQISADAVVDLTTTPNAFAGIVDDTTWNFSTLPGVRVVANFNTLAFPAPMQDGLYSSTALGAATATPFTFVYDISSLGLGTADELRITVATTGTNLNNGGGNGIAVVGGNDGWWEEQDGALGYTVVIEDASNADITSSFNIDLTGASIRWVNTTPSITLNVAGSGPFAWAATNQIVDLPTGQTAETSFSATRTGNTIGQFQQLRFAISEIPGGNLFADWISGKPGVGGQTGVNEDPDGDGIDNGVENFFGTEPGEFSQGLLAGSVNSGAGTFTFTHPQGTLAADLTAAYQWSKDLQSFNAGGTTDGGGTKVEFSVHLDTPVAGTTTVTATVTGTAASKLFVGVKVTQN